MVGRYPPMPSRHFPTQQLTHRSMILSGANMRFKELLKKLARQLHLIPQSQADAQVPTSPAPSTAHWVVVLGAKRPRRGHVSARRSLADPQSEAKHLPSDACSVVNTLLVSKSHNLTEQSQEPGKMYLYLDIDHRSFSLSDSASTRVRSHISG